MSANTLSIEMPISSAAPKGRVLCVDDEPSILRALAWLLNKEFDVVTAQSAHHGLELVRQGDFDVVISDQRMPEMSGVDFLNQVRTLAPRAMRILLTGYSDMQAVLRSVNESEIFRYVTKPWNVSELPRIVAQAAEIARRQPAVAPAPELPEAAPLRQETRLLVLDDDPATHSAVEMSAGDLAQVRHATNPVDAFRILEKEEIGVILAERSLGKMDLTHLLCLLKREHPQLVSIVLTDSQDSDLIARLINQGQIYRFIHKPVKAGQLRLALKSAIAKRQELLDHPLLAERHLVDAADLPDEAIAFPAAIAGAAAALSEPIPALPTAPSDRLFGCLGNLVSRVFGR